MNRSCSMFRPTTPSRRSALMLGLAVLLAPSVLAGPKRPNILFIFSDDHATQAIGAYGSTINHTPNIDRLADAGAVFLSSFCTNSLCGPSRASIQTGKHSHLNGFMRNGNRFDSSQTTFPKLLQAAGYQTAVIGKWHLGTDPVGYDYWEVLPGQGHYYNPDFIEMNGKRKRYAGYCTDIITERSLDWLEHRDPEKPFMLMCQHKAPHRNWAPPPRYFGLFEGRTIPEPPTLQDDYSGRSLLLAENEMTVAHHMFWGHDMKFHGEDLFPEYFRPGLANGEYRRMTPEQKTTWDAWYEPRNQKFIEQMKTGELSAEDVLHWKYQRYMSDYLECIQAVDESVGRILDYLDKTGLADDTIVIYSSDQGFYLGEHGWFDKRWIFEESLKMPFLIRWPGVVAPHTQSTALIQNIDYGPTFLDLAGAPVPAEMQGRSLVPLLRNGCRAPADWRDAVYYAYYENAAVHNVPIHDGIRTQQYTLAFFPRTGEWQLFDLKEDPLQMRSVHDDPAYSRVFASLQKRYRDLREFYEVNPAIIPTTRGDEKWWRERDRQKQAEVKKAKEQHGGVKLAFIGDSITHAWDSRGEQVWEKYYARRNAINLGFSGDRTEHVIWRLTHGEFSGLKPAVAVVMIGTNNTGHRMQDPKQVADGVRRILDIIQEQSPETKILLLGIFPRAHDPLDPMRLNNTAINQFIRRFADGQKIFYQDIGSVFLDEDGTLPDEIMPDFLHPNEQGYELWAEAIEPALKKLGI